MITTTLKQYSSLPLQLITGSIVITYRFDTTIFFNQHFSWHYLCHMVNTNWNVLKIIGEDCKLLIHLTKHEDVAPLLGHRSCLCITSGCWRHVTLVSLRTFVVDGCTRATHTQTASSRVSSEYHTINCSVIQCNAIQSIDSQTALRRQPDSFFPLYVTLTVMWSLFNNFHKKIIFDYFLKAAFDVSPPICWTLVWSREFYL